MNRRNLYATLVCVSSIALCASRDRPQEISSPGSENSSSSVSRIARRVTNPKTSPTRTTSESHQKVETPMATDERLEAPGWWPTKPFASRQDFVGTTQCVRCHSKKTVTQLTTPMAHASTQATNSDILREHNPISLQLGPHTYTISRGHAGIVYSVSDGTNSISEPLAWAFGLGNKAQTYIYQRDGFFYESRLSFY